MNTLIARALIAFGTVLVLGGINYSILHKEGIKRDGDIVFLDLAPVDPRSLMQGDYMTLNFDVARQIENSLQILPLRARRGEPTATPHAHAVREGEIRTATVTVDERRVARFAAAPATNVLKLRYRIRDGRVWLGTNAFFFEEGRAAQYEKARYGEFRVDRGTGEAVLVGLRDAKLAAL